MNAKAEFLFLGTGASGGVPMIGCHCPVCSSDDRFNKRLRPSGFLIVGEKKLLIDIGPDFRLQALLYDLDRIDGVLITHSHYDHIAGIDELRTYYLLQKQISPILLSQHTLEELKRRFNYLFLEKSWGSSLAAQLDFHVIEKERGEISFQNIPIQYMTYEQGKMKVLGFRFGDFAYLTDLKDYPETLFHDLYGVKTLVISALRREKSPMHLTLDEAIAFVQRVDPEKGYFTHIAHDLDHRQTNAHLPKNIKLAHDGLKIGFYV